MGREREGEGSDSHVIHFFLTCFLIAGGSEVGTTVYSERLSELKG
jgi:hypothetical protein